MIQANTTASEIVEELLPYLGSGKKYPENDVQLLKLEAKAKTLSKVDIREGYILLAACSMFRGKFAEMRSRYQIAKEQGLDPGQRLNHAITLSHAGFFIEAVEIVKHAAPALSDPIFAAHKAMMCCQFNLAGTLFDKASKMQLSTQKDSNFHVIPTMVNAAKEALIDDSQAALQAELAGEIMRSNNVYQKGEADFSIYPKDDGGSELIVATLNIPASYDKASDMTFSYAEKLILNGWDKSNFIIRFRGDSVE